LQNLLLEGQQQGKISALIVDEAHKLGPDVLEEIRLLGNFEAADHKLLQILLVGQTELEDNLERQDLRQLKQRIALWLRLSPLGSTEVGEYIRYRWAAAGGKEPPFSTEAIDCVALASRGIPRVINNLCETALTLALGEGNAEVKGRHVLAAADEMKIGIKRDVTEPTPAPSVDPEVVAEAPLEQYHNGRPTGWAKWAERLRLSARHETA